MLLQQLKEYSNPLRNNSYEVVAGVHFERNETLQILQWIDDEKSYREDGKNVCVLMGGAGSGKTVIMRDLLIELEKRGKVVIGLKADWFKADKEELLIGGKPIREVFEIILQEGEVGVLLIDQIDALSLALTSNRYALTRVINLIEEVKQLQNVRIVFSCRPFDFYYDASFTRYNRCDSFDVSPLKREDVINTVKTFGIKEGDVQPYLLELLGNPQNLFLFCKVHDQLDLTKKITQQTLYRELWNSIVCQKAKTKGYQPEKIIEMLTILAREMYNRQSLILSRVNIPSAYEAEEAFLSSEGILNSDNNSIQFAHQTMFEYVNARLFFEGKQTIENLVDEVHQGLFIRARLKHILDYQRDEDMQIYLNNVNEILVGKKDGVYRYRFHLRHLVVSMLAGYDDLTVEEKRFIERVILPDSQYASIFAHAINNITGLDVLSGTKAKRLLGEEDWSQAFLHVSNNLVRRYSIATDVVQRLVSQKPVFWEKNKKAIIHIIECINTPINGNPKLYGILKPVLQIIDSPEDFELHSFYLRLVETNPQDVCDRLLQYIDAQLKKQKGEGAYDFRIPWTVESVFSELERKTPDIYWAAGVKMLRRFCEERPLKNCKDLQGSSFFLLYNRSNMAHDFAQETYTKLIENIEKAVVETKPGLDDILIDYSQEIYTPFHCLALYGWLQNVEAYKDVAYDYLCKNVCRDHYSSLLSYLQLEMFSKLKSRLTDEQILSFLEILEHLSPEWEKTRCELFERKGSPKLHIGYTKGQYYEIIGETNLKKLSKKAWTEYERLKRKYRDLSFSEPNKITSEYGYQSLPQEAFEKMSPEEELQAMRKYNDDSIFCVTGPSLQGNAERIGTLILDDPENQFQVLMTASEDPKINSEYLIRSLPRFFDVDIDRDKILRLYLAIIKKYEKEIREYDKAEIISVVRLTDYFVNKHWLPNEVVDFVSRVALEADDSTDDQVNRPDINSAINMVRGCAVNTMIEAFGFHPKSQDVYDTLMKVAQQTTSCTTRIAGIFNLGKWLRVCGERNLKELLLCFLGNYDAPLLKIPLHRWNPFLYCLNRNFVEFRTYFEKSITCVESYRINAELLLRAYLSGIDEAASYLDRMAAFDPSARPIILNCVRVYYNIERHEQLYPYIEQYLEYPSEDLGNVYDEMFKNYEQWDRYDLEQFLEKFFASEMCAYTNHYVYKMLLSLSENIASECVKWLNQMYARKTELGGIYFQAENMIEVLLKSYNAIREFDKTDPELEEAINILDSLMQTNQGVEKFTECFNKMEI